MQLNNKASFMTKLIHGSNIQSKIENEKNETNKALLDEIKTEYHNWLEKIEKLKGKSDDQSIKQRVSDLNLYKNFIDQPKFKKEQGNPNGFTSQSKLHSTVLEEFMHHLLIEIPKLNGKNLNFGPTNAYSNLYFSPKDLDSFENDSGLTINTKDQDYAISKEIKITTSLNSSSKVENKNIYVPVVSIECKTYLDKTMYEGSVATAEKIKRGNPYSLFLIVTETYEVDHSVDPQYSEIDQIYILRKSSNRSLPRNDIYADVVIDLFRTVENHLNSDWQNVSARIASGRVIK